MGCVRIEFHGHVEFKVEFNVKSQVKFKFKFNSEIQNQNQLRMAAPQGMSYAFEVDFDSAFDVALN